MIISVINQKGGVGKTTTVVNLGVALAEAGEDVLLIDLDTQRDLTSYAGGVPGVAFQQADARSLPSLLASAPAFTLLDCPPALGAEAAAALRVADIALVPLQAEYLALRGLKRLLETVEVARDPRRKGNPNLQLKILLTMADSRDPASADIISDVQRRFKGHVLPVVVKRSPLFSGAALAHQSILQYSPRSHGAAAYREVARQFIKEAKAEAKKETKHGAQK